VTWTAPRWGTGFSGRWWLQPGEQILWEGGPDPSVVLSKQDAYLIPFTILWGGFAIFWEIGVSASGWSFGSIWGIPFVLIGFYMMVGRFFYKRWDRRRTRYFLTDCRAVIERSGGQQVQEAPLATTPMQLQRSRDGRHGSLIWSLAPAPASAWRRTGPARWSYGTRSQAAWLRGTGWPLSNQMASGEVAFLDVEDFDNLMEAVNRAKGSASAISPGTSWPPPTRYVPPPPQLPVPLPTGAREWGRWPAPPVSAIVLLLGLALAIGTGVFAVHRLSPYLDHPPTMTTPGAARLLLEPGTYVLFEHPVGTGQCYGSQCFVFGPNEVRVTSASGATVPVVADVTTDRITRSDFSYPGFVEFHVPRKASYLVQVTSPRRANVVIDPSPGQEVHAFAGWIALGVGGLVLALGAAVCLVGALVHRRRLRYPRPTFGL
jgi:hypothetical protein